MVIDLDAVTDVIDLFGLTDTDATFGSCVVCPPDERDSCRDLNPAHHPYRYTLTRIWDPTLPIVCFVMLNPSTATAELGDPTIRRCMGFAERWGHGGLTVVNLFALRSTDPTGLLGHADPVGPENDQHISNAVARYTDVVCAWGSHRMASGRAPKVLRDLIEPSVPPRCLGVTETGSPRHPLYAPYGAHVPYDERPV